MPMLMDAAKGAGGDNLPIMQDDLIHWNGQPIAVVVAESQEQADHAATLIRASYELEPATTSFEEAKRNGTAEGKFMNQDLRKEIGDAEAALAAAALSIDVTYSTLNQSHNAIEPHAATIHWADGDLIVHDASQAVTHTASSLAVIFGMSEKRVHVTSPFVGGGFGGKLLWQHQVLGAAAAKLTGRPVRIALSREGVYRVVGGRPTTEQRVAIGASVDGRFEAIVHTGVSATTRRTALAEAFMVSTGSSYAAGSYLLDNRLALLDIIPNTQMRAPGGAVGTFALESAVDELADKLNIDPIDLRIRNEPETDPTKATPFSSRNMVELWRLGRERFGWAKRDRTPGTVRDGEWLVGMGCAASNHPYIRMPGGAARLTLTRSGHVKVHIAAHEMGMGTATVQAQILAERLGLPMERVEFLYGDSHFPGLIMAAGSQQTASVGASILAAHHSLVNELLKLGGKKSALEGLSPEEVEGRDAGLSDLTDHARHESYEALLTFAGRDEITVEASAPEPLEAMHWSMHSNGAMFCEVRVNVVTCEIRVSRFLGYFDCGRIMNSKTAASRLRGGIIMGLGLALMEETLVDGRNGRVMNPSLAEYHFPVYADVPEIDVACTDIADSHTPMGAHGIGELGITGTGAAVANAIFNATGKRVRNLPITLDKLL